MTAPSDPPPDPTGDGAPVELTRATSSRPTGPPAPDPRAAPGQPGEPRHRPWAWIAVCAVLALAVVGVTVWALSLNSDLDHQRDQTAAAQQQADNAASEVDQLTQDVNDALDQAGETSAAAKGKLETALADLKRRLGAMKGESKPPAAGSATPEAAATPAATPTVVENATPDGA